MASRVGEERAIYWLEEPAQFDVPGGIGYCTIRSGRRVFEFRSTVEIMLAGMANASSAYGAHLAEIARHAGNVVKLVQPQPCLITVRGESI